MVMKLTALAPVYTAQPVWLSTRNKGRITRFIVILYMYELGLSAFLAE